MLSWHRFPGPVAAFLSCLFAFITFGRAGALARGSISSSRWPASGSQVDDRQSPATLLELWDAHTLASFSLSQLSAFARLAKGLCPMLSRAISCVRNGGKLSMFSSTAQPLEMHTWRRLISVYLEEEADLARRQTVGMLRHIWRNYESLAFGHDEILPVSGVGADGWGGLGMTLVDAMDTLWLMGLNDEFERAAKWVEDHLDFEKDLNVNFFETTIRQLGSLVSAYSLSQRPQLLAKAEDLGNRLLHAFPRPMEMELSMSQAKGMMSKILNKMGLTDADMDKLEPAWAAVQAEKQKAGHLPKSDVNLKTGEAQNLAGFISLAEAYVPVEFKALALLTRNCSFAAPLDGVLRVVNKSISFYDRGLAPILLNSEGNPFPSPENRVSMGSRGDSFYEYLLKDWVFSGFMDDAPARRLWIAFLENLPGLIIEAYPTQVDKVVAASRANSSTVWKDPRRSGSFRRLRRGGSKSSTGEPMREVQQQGFLAHRRGDTTRGEAGRRGGWYESEGDVPEPWVFLKEITFVKSIPKMDHLICFLPGALALDHYFTVGGPGTDSPLHDLRSLIENSTWSEMLLGHKLLQTCIHMYFRTATDLAPEITRFDAYGMVDDLGSMHNILRPETVESLTLMWRTSKAQIYRNWGQRLLTAFSRQRTDYGYSSLKNVNRPDSQRNLMPSFFLAETVKYLFLLFSGDDALPLDQIVLNTEAHPLPLATSELAWWPCVDPPRLKERQKSRQLRMRRRYRLKRRRPREAPAHSFKVTVDNRKGSLGLRLTRHKASKDYMVTNISAGGVVDTWNLFFPSLEIKLGDVVDSVNGIEGAGLLEEARMRQWLTMKVLRPVPQSVKESPTTPPPVAAVPRFIPAVPIDAGGGSLAVAAVMRPLRPQPATQDPSPVGKSLLDQPAVASPRSSALRGKRGGDEACWKDGFSSEICCNPSPGGNSLCWDSFYSYERCCPG